MSSKRRTKKQKLQARKRHQALPSLGTKKARSASRVKGQNEPKQKSTNLLSFPKKKAKYTEEFDNLASIKKDLFKSLSLATLIVMAELMLYLAWQGK